MKIRTVLVAAAMATLTAVGLTTGTAQAAPAPSQIGYTAKVSGGSVIFRTDAGSLRDTNGGLQVVDGKGSVLTTIPLTIALNGTPVPVSASVNGRTATITPDRTVAATARQNAAAGKVLAEKFTSKRDRDDKALARLGSYVSTAVSIGALVGTIIGAAAGCVVGGVIFPAIGCIPGVITGAGFGGIAGTIIAGGPTLIGAVTQYFNTVNSPFDPKKDY
ncbi:hypothetical protein [Williamsia sterculiae]|nr:hypothetical protein [Williamsia sterculiae]